MSDMWVQNDNELSNSYSLSYRAVYYVRTTRSVFEPSQTCRVVYRFQSKLRDRERLLFA